MPRRMLGRMQGRMRWHASEAMSVARADTATHRLLRDRLISLTMATVFLDAVFSVIIWLTERGQDGSQIHGYGDALFWTTCQLLSVSSNLANPISVTARVVDVLMEIWAITVVATLAGSFGSFFHRRGLERYPMAQPDQ
jgi:hypothetical protein